MTPHKTIYSDNISDLSNINKDLVGKSLYDLLNLNITDEFVDVILYQLLLYARHQKKTMEILI